MTSDPNCWDIGQTHIRISPAGTMEKTFDEFANGIIIPVPPPERRLKRIADAHLVHAP